MCGSKYKVTEQLGHYITKWGTSWFIQVS